MSALAGIPERTSHRRLATSVRPGAVLGGIIVRQFVRQPARLSKPTTLRHFHGYL